MGTPIRHDALSPKDLQYYAPRKSRDGVNDAPPIQPSPKLDEPRGPQAFDNSYDIAPLPNAFRTSHEPLRAPEYQLRPAGYVRTKALAVVACAAALGITVGIGLFQWRNGSLSANTPEISLATRLQAATAELQKVSQPVMAPLLTVTDASGDMNAPLPLGVEVKNYTADATIDLGGLPAGTLLSTGAAKGDGQWRIAVDDLPKTRVTPPPGFVGLMTVMAEVRTGNGQAIVRSPLRLIWRQSPPVAVEAAEVHAPAATPVVKPPAQPPATVKVDAAPAPRKMDAKEVAALLQRADELMANGDLAAARLLLQRVAETNNARAAFQLASTYDPIVIKKFGSNRVAADPALAQFWYQRARDWGSSDASGSIEALASRDR